MCVYLKIWSNTSANVGTAEDPMPTRVCLCSGRGSTGLCAALSYRKIRLCSASC